MRKQLFVAIVAFLLVTVSCSALSPETQQTAVSALAKMLEQGTITQEQHDALVEALTGGGWGRFWALAGTYGASILTVILGALGLNRFRASRAAKTSRPPM